MTWWVWGLVLWSTVASVAAFWLAALVSELHSQLWAERSPESLDIPWQPGTSLDAQPLLDFDPQAIFSAFRARRRRTATARHEAAAS
jgi:hypothetical protein